MTDGRKTAVCALAIVLAWGASARANDVPLPRPRPDLESPAEPQPGEGAASNTPGISACAARLSGEGALAQVLPPLAGPGGCGASDVVRLDAVLVAGEQRVSLLPAPILRCTLAEAVAHWVREDLAPAAAALGSPLKAIENYDSYDCRGRNRVAGAKLSEHGKANALDVRSIRLANGKAVELTDPNVSRAFREAIRTSACTRFMTVLGPGSDGYHESHIHVDLAERHNGYRLCQWDVRVPQPGDAEGVARSAHVPVPRPRPVLEPPPPHAGIATGGKIAGGR